MQGWNDYYRILQVHHIAEPEVIESAYKRLAKKYHPDVNKAKDSDIRMKQIVIAYEILKDPEKRKDYDTDWVKKQGRAISEETDLKKEINALSVTPAKTVLVRYFESIKNREFENAYEFITSIDKNKISKEEFLKWQNTVTKIFDLQDFECRASTIDRNTKLNGLIYKDVVGFIVITVEHNIVMNRLEKDIINKKVVLEKEGWRIHLGYEDIRPHITKFEELDGLLVAKSVINEMMELYSNIDNLTGLFNKKGFIDAAEKEVWRYGRYGSKFSLMLLELDYDKGTISNKGQEFKDYSVEWAGKILKESIRKLDIIGRWGETGFIILMPEADLASIIRASLKIKKIFATKKLIYNNTIQKLTLSIGIDEFEGSLENTIERLNHQIDVAKRYK